MRTIANLFGRSPFNALQKHMEEVLECCNRVSSLFDALRAGDYEKIERLATEISEHEHEADRIKNDIRNRLPKSFFLPVAREDLFEVLHIQDSIADKAEDVGVLMTLRRMEPLDFMVAELDLFLEKVIATVRHASDVVQELDELLETTFGGAEADKVRTMIDEVSLLEHEADVAQKGMLRKLFDREKEFTYLPFVMWMKILEEVGEIANRAERLANRIRNLLILE